MALPAQFEQAVIEALGVRLAERAPMLKLTFVCCTVHVLMVRPRRWCVAHDLAPCP